MRVDGREITVSPDDRRRLEAIVGDGNSLQKHVARARALIATADGCGTNEVMRRSDLSYFAYTIGVYEDTYRKDHDGWRISSRIMIVAPNRKSA